MILYNDLILVYGPQIGAGFVKIYFCVKVENTFHIYNLTIFFELIQFKTITFTQNNIAQALRNDKVLYKYVSAVRTCL